MLEANPDNAEAYVLQGSLHLAAKEPDKAEVSFREAIKKRPASPLGYTSLAKFYIAQKKTDEAEVVLHAGLEKSSPQFRAAA